MAAPDDSPESRDRLSLGGPAGPGGPPVPRFVDATLDNLQALGMSPSMVERFVHFWKRYGLSRALILVAAVTMPLWRYVWIPTTLSAGVETWAEGSGATLTVGDWSSDWFDIAVTGEDVRLETTGPYLERAILAADAVEIDWSLLREIRNTLSRAKSLVFGSTPADEPIHTLRIDDGVLHFEHLLTGRWNWQDAVESRATSGLSSSSRLYRLPLLEANKLRIAIVEHLPGDSGGGLIEQKTATLHLDDVKVRISDLMLPDDDRDQGGGFQVQGRTADGRFALDGRLNLARWMAPGAGSTGGLVPPPASPQGVPTPGWRRVSMDEAGAVWSPAFTAAIYLENIGAPAFARLLSSASLLPSAGTMNGKIAMAVADGVLRCEIDLDLRDIAFAANPSSTYVRARRVEVERGVANLVVNRHVNKPCEANWGSPGFRLVNAIYSEVTSEAVKGAPAAVQAAAGYDRLRYVTLDPQAMAGNYDAAMSESIGRAIGGDAGALVAKELAKPDGAGGSSMSRGVKSVGRGFKRLFGGGKR